jgi:CRP-like cAMP-binding protein
MVPHRHQCCEESNMGFENANDALRLFFSKVSARSALGPDEEQAVLALPARPRKIDAHREFVRLGEQVSHSCLVAQGLVSRFAVMEDGRRQLISLHLPGDLVDLYSLMLPAAPSPLVALTPTTIFDIPHASLTDLASRYPALAAAFWRECVVDGGIVAQWLISLGRRDARGRLAHLLCEMAIRSARIGRMQAGRFSLPMTQEHMADALGLTSVHVNRSLKALREEGTVQVSRGEAVVLDWDALVYAAEFDPAYLHLPEWQRPLELAATA